jgi:hypothetical protein
MPCGPLSGLVVLDFDGEEGRKFFEEKFDGRELPPTAMTPKGGYHAFFAHPKGPDAALLKNAVRILPGVDIRCHGGYVLVPSAYPDGRSWIQPPNGTAPPLPDWILSVLRPSTPPQAVSSDVDGLPPGVGQGQRNDAAARLAGRYLAKLRPEEAWPILQAWNKKNRPELPEAELRATLFNIARKERDKGPVIELVDSAELSRLVVTPKAKLIDPFLSAGSKNILAGWQGSYKSTLVLNLACCINNTLPVFGRFDTSKGRVLYVDRENNPELTNLRVEKIAHGMHGMRGGITFQFPREKPDLADRRVREAYIRTIEAGKYDLVVFDSFLCFFNLRNENDNTEVRNVLELVGEIPAKTGAAILFIDHAGKASAEKMKAGIRVTPRGASAKGDWADVVMTLEEKDDEARKLRVLRFSKTRYNLPMPPMLLEVGTNLVFAPSGEDEICPVFTVRQTVDDTPGVPASKLYKLLAARTGCSERTAMRSTGRTVDLGFIQREERGKSVNFYPIGGVTLDDVTNNLEPQNVEEKTLV